MEELNLKVAGGYMHQKFLLPYCKTRIGLKIKPLINTVYDSGNDFLWSGGRWLATNLFTFEQPTVEKIIASAKKYNKLGIGFSFIFTNYFITEDMLDDDKCNTILKECQNDINSVTVSSPLLAKYIRETYPKYIIYYSATNNAITADEINKLCEDELYDIVVPGADMSRNFEELSKIKYKDKVELIIDEHCYSDCPYRMDHYSRISQAIIDHNTKGEEIPFNRICCYAKEDPKMLDHRLCSLNLEEIKTVLSLGFRNIKLSHRDYSSQVYQGTLEQYMSCLTKAVKEVLN